MNFEGLVNVCVFIGGCSVEHEISLISGLQAVLNMDKSKYNVRVVYLSKENEFIYLKTFDSLDYFKNGCHLNKKVNCYFKRIGKITYMVYRGKKWKVDVCFPIVHGSGVEDGSVAGLINLLKVPNVCSGVTSSGVAQDKGLCKRLLKSSGVRMCKFIEVTSESYEKKISKILNNFSFPLIIKPALLGSSIGINIAYNIDELKKGITSALTFGEKVIVEQKLDDFVEYNMACFSNKETLITSLVEEVKSDNSYLTFDDKYNDGGLKEVSKENRCVPANISKELEDEIKSHTKVIYKTLGFNGVIRVDYLYDKTNNKLYFNEVNTIPGSLAFYLYKNYSFKELIDILIKDALFRYSKNDNLISSFDSNILSVKNLKMKK